MADKSFITTGERVRNYLAIGFVLSLLINLISGVFYPNLQKHQEDDQVEKVSVTKRVQVKVPTPPPPTPTPPPSPTPPPNTPPPQRHQVVQPQLKVNLVKTHNNSNAASTETYTAPKAGTENGVPAGQGTGTPAPTNVPTGTPEPQCGTPYADATVTQQVSPDYPDSARDLNLGPVTVLVKVTVGPDGSLVVPPTVQSSSNNSAIDQAALRAARESQYAPKVVNCKKVTGQYIFSAEFDPN